MKSTYCLIGAAAFALAGFAAVPAHADVIQAFYLYPNLGTVFENDGTQNTPFSFSLLGGELTLSSGTNVVTLTSNVDSSFAAAAFNGPELIDLTSSTIFSVLFDPSSTIVGFDQADISFDSSHIWLNMQGLPVTIGQTAVIDIRTSGDGTRVPEPITLSLFGVGAAGALALRRRQKKAA